MKEWGGIFNLTDDLEENVTILEKAVVGLIIFDVLLAILLFVSTYYACKNYCRAKRGRRRAEIPMADLRGGIYDVGPLGVGKPQPATCRT